MMSKTLFYSLLISVLNVTACSTVPAEASPETVFAENAASSPAEAEPTQITSPSQNQTTVTSADTQETEFEVWKADFMARASAKGYGRDLIEDMIVPTTLRHRVIESDRSQPEFSRPIWGYVDTVLSAARLNQGRDKLLLSSNIFDAIERRYQVDRNVLTAIWGLESSYGKIIGNQDVVSGLATLAYEGRRRDFAEQQLYALMDMVRSGAVRRDQLIGSWAGAMGMTQFIPTTFRDYAVDFDGDGNKDLWQNPSDALGSAAHYLSRHGWQAGRPVLTEVKLGADFDYELSDGRRKNLGEWRDLGVAPLAGGWQGFDMTTPAKLLVPAGHKGPIFLTYKNYDVIKRYNNSTSYALGITTLSEAFGGRAAIRTDWPRTDMPLSRTDKETMQRRLTSLGYDTKGVDGQIGPNTRKAVRAWQAANGYLADGYVEQNLFVKIMGR